MGNTIVEGLQHNRGIIFLQFDRDELAKRLQSEPHVANAPEDVVHTLQKGWAKVFVGFLFTFQPP